MCNNNCSNCNCSNNCGEYSNFGIQRLSSPAEKSTGDSRAIRIGNDIKLDVTIQELTGMDIINIKSIKCFIINTTPMLQDHRGTAYEIRRCGFPHYYAHPFEEYHGFGVYPGFPKNWHHNLFPRPYYDFYHKYYGCHYLKPIHRHNKPFEFIAPVKALEDRNKVRVFFPATAQMLCGLYSLTFVIDLYEPGYHQNNLRTVTVDYNNVFELVPNAEGRSGDIIIDIDKQIGLNVYDNNMFGNTTQIAQLQEVASTIQSIQIEGAGDIRVGEFEMYTATCIPDSKAIEWKIIGDNTVAILANAGKNKVAVFAKNVTNVVDGKTDIILQCSSTDGSEVIAEKKITIHNYAVGIFFNGTTQIPYEGLVTGNIYIEQEDGTKISPCERGCDCQSFGIRSYKIMGDGQNMCRAYFGKDNDFLDCSWSYDDIHGDVSSIEIDSTDPCVEGKCCGKDIFTVQNLPNHNTATVTITFVGNAKDSTGNYITKNIDFQLLGSNGASSDNNGVSDRYISSAEYSNGVIALHNIDNEVDPITINVSELQNVDADYWYDATTGN